MALHSKDLIFTLALNPEEIRRYLEEKRSMGLLDNIRGLHMGDDYFWQNLSQTYVAFKFDTHPTTASTVIFPWLEDLAIRESLNFKINTTPSKNPHYPIHVSITVEPMREMTLTIPLLEEPPKGLP